VAKVVKPHGLRGEVVVELWSDRPERLAPGSVLQSDRGDLEVVSSRPHQHRHLVAFVGVEDHAGAEALRGLVLRARPVPEPGGLWVHQLVGATVVDPDGTVLGTVAFVVGEPAEGRLTVEVPPGLLDEA
jgi:16S rRNA processing protein RimM